MEKSPRTLPGARVTPADDPTSARGPGGADAVAGRLAGGLRPAVGSAPAGVSGTAGTPEWVADLARFLSEAAGVEAVRFDPEARRVAVATLGQVDEAAIEQRLRAALAAIEERIDGAKTAPAAAAPAGFVLAREAGGAAVLAKESCVTAPRFWKWREFAWPEPEPSREEVEVEDWRTLAALAAVCGVAGLSAWAVERFEWGGPGVVRGLYLVALVAGGWDAAIDTVAKLRRRQIDIHFLMLSVAVGAMAIGAWGEAALLLFLFSASGAMEAFALMRTHRAVESLLKAAPKQALRVEPDGTEREVPVEMIAPGDVLRVKPGAVFSADAVVVRGDTACDESNLTGEARPVEKQPGEPVFSGTLNLWGAVDVRVVRRPAESTLQRVIRLIRTAQKLRAPSERFTDRFGAGYTYAVLGAVTVMFFVWWQGLGLPAFAVEEGTRSAFYRAMTLLVVASPCALVLSIPSAILAAIAWGARHGVLFRGGAAIEKLAEVDLVALDKTGTLTTGELEVTSVESFPSGREDEVLALAVALESHSEHPLARAIVRQGQRQGVQPAPVAEFRAMVGRGVRGRTGGAAVVLGRRELLLEGPLAEWAGRLPPAPPEFSEVWVIGPDLLGRLLLRDEVRAESAAVLARLKALGVRTAMLTGDRRQAAEQVARTIGLDEVRAGLSPEEKVAAVVGWRREGHKVAMVGDGVNDAPSLAAAYVSVAMGARGSDAALEQAEVILMHDRIEKFLSALWLSHRARRIIRQNLFVALGTVVVMAAGALLGLVPLPVGVLAHEGSTVLVCLNSLRLLFGREPDPGPKRA
jgi:Cd2+/Zn2+-exporting ATPase